jgi:hypothetical protein
MAERIVQEESLTLVADAIRAKGGTTDPLSFPDGFADAISAIQAGGGGAQYGVMWDKSRFPKEATLLTDLPYVPSYLCYSSGSTGAYYYIETFNMPNAIKEISDYAFYGCGNLKNIDMSNITTIGNYAFYKCHGLSLNDFDMSNVTTIGEYAFASNQSRVFSGKLNLPLVSKISNSAFRQSGVSVANLPLATTIASYAFYNCANLNALILRSETMCALSNANALNGTPIKSGIGYIYVPAALVDSYKAASNWSTYANQFRALEDYTVDGTITGALDESKI